MPPACGVGVRRYTPREAEDSADGAPCRKENGCPTKEGDSSRIAERRQQSQPRHELKRRQGVGTTETRPCQPLPPVALRPKGPRPPAHQRERGHSAVRRRPLARVVSRGTRRRRAGLWGALQDGASVVLCPKGCGASNERMPRPTPFPLFHARGWTVDTMAPPDHGRSV